MTKTNSLFRIISIFICIVVIVGMMPLGSSAAEENHDNQSLDEPSSLAEEPLPETEKENENPELPPLEKSVGDTKEDLQASDENTINEPSKESPKEKSIQGSSLKKAPLLSAPANGWTTENGFDVYYQNGAKLSGADGSVNKNVLVKIGSDLYYLNASGKRATGVQKVNGKIYYFHTDFRAVGGLFKTKDGSLYYFHPSSKYALTGLRTISGSKYYFDENTGKAKRGFVTTAKKVTYRFGSDFKAISGFYKSSSNLLYYFNPKTKCAASGLTKVNGKLYYFYPSTSKGIRKYAASGLTKVGKNKYFFNPKTKVAKKGFVTVGGARYYMNSNGAAVSGLKIINGRYYYFFKGSRQMARSRIVTVNKKRCYFNSDGAMFNGYKKINGKRYHFNYMGKAASKMDKKASKLSSKTKYLILVNLKTCRVGVFKGKKGNWDRIFYWKCGPGMKKTPSPKGTFIVGKNTIGKGIYDRTFIGKTTKYKFWYATRIYKSFLFHSVPCYVEASPRQVSNPTLGKPASHGCIRLKVENAYWIYSHIKKGTKVVIYAG